MPEVRYVAHLLRCRHGLHDRSGNVHAGLVVDSEITNPHANDYYLLSHGGLKGSKPRPLFSPALSLSLTANSEPARALHCSGKQYPHELRRVSVVFYFFPNMVELIVLGCRAVSKRSRTTYATSTPARPAPYPSPPPHTVRPPPVRTQTLTNPPRS